MSEPITPIVGQEDRDKDLSQAIQETRKLVNTAGTKALVVNDLTSGDLHSIAWSGSASHLRNVAGQLDRVESGEVEYLTVRAPNGHPIAKGAIDYVDHEGFGTIFQLTTIRELEGLGIARHLIATAEDRIAKRGLPAAVVGVEDSNERARSIYERFGYVPYDEEDTSWESEDDNGKKYTKHAHLTLLKKTLEYE